MNSVGDRLKALRKAENLTQIEFSKRLLISQPYLSGLESGNIAPTSKLIKLICLEFGVNEDWLAAGSGNMYDEVYENDKTFLVETSNAALLRIMTLLTTKSNVKYGLYANGIDLFSALLLDGKYFDEDSEMKYLESLQDIVMNLERMVYVAATARNEVDLESHKEGIYNDLAQICTLAKELNNKRINE